MADHPAATCTASAGGDPSPAEVASTPSAPTAPIAANTSGSINTDDGAPPSPTSHRPDVARTDRTRSSARSAQRTGASSGSGSRKRAAVASSSSSRRKKKAKAAASSASSGLAEDLRALFDSSAPSSSEDEEEDGDGNDDSGSGSGSGSGSDNDGNSGGHDDTSTGRSISDDDGSSSSNNNNTNSGSDETDESDVEMAPSDDNIRNSKDPTTSMEKEVTTTTINIITTDDVDLDVDVDVDLDGIPFDAADRLSARDAYDDGGYVRALLHTSNPTNAPLPRSFSDTPAGHSSNSSSNPLSADTAPPPLDNPYLHKMVRIVRGRHAGRRGRITHCGTRGWWRLDNPALGTQSVQSTDCRLMEEVAEEELAEYRERTGRVLRRVPMMMVAEKRTTTTTTTTTTRRKGGGGGSDDGEGDDDDDDDNEEEETASAAAFIDGGPDPSPSPHPGRATRKRRAREEEWKRLYPPAGRPPSWRDWRESLSRDVLERLVEMSVPPPGLLLSSSSAAAAASGSSASDHVQAQGKTRPRRPLLAPGGAGPKPSPPRGEAARGQPSPPPSSQQQQQQDPQSQTADDESASKNATMAPTTTTTATTPMDIEAGAGDAAADRQDGTPSRGSATAPAPSAQSKMQPILPPVVLASAHDDTVLPEAVRHLPPTTRIDIFDRRSGKILSGPRAVAVRDLPSILREHSEYEPLVPPPSLRDAALAVVASAAATAAVREGRSGPAVTVGATVEPQAPRVRSSALEGRDVLVTAGRLRGLILKINACLPGGWYIVSNLLSSNEEDLDHVVSAAHLDLLGEGPSVHSNRSPPPSPGRDEGRGADIPTAEEALGLFKLSKRQLRLRIEALQEERRDIGVRIGIDDGLGGSSAIKRHDGSADDNAIQSRSASHLTGLRLYQLKQKFEKLGNQIFSLKEKLTSYENTSI